MSNYRNASLFLRTIDLADAKNGTYNAAMTSFTWYGINLRTVLGDMYDDYDLFNICLNTVNFSYTPAAFFGTNDDRCLTINVSGLPFINQTYSQATANNTMSTCMGGVGLNPSSTNCNNFYSSNIALFGKNQDVCNITITYNRASDGAIAEQGASTFPQAVFLFKIIK